MPIPANRVKDLCFVHVHTNAPGAADPGYARRVLQTIYKQPLPATAKVLCTRGAPQNQQFFGASLKKAGDERQLNFLDKASFSIHLEEFTDGQGARGQVCAVLSKHVPGPQAVRCACGRMVNPGPKARCPYCGRAVVPGAGGGEGEIALVEQTEATVPAIPGLDAGAAESSLPSSDLGARMSARSRGGATRGSWMKENLKLVAGGGAVVVVVLVWLLFFRGKTISSAWKETFQNCKWEPCIAELERQVKSGAVAERPELEFRLAQAKLEKKAQSVNNPAGSGPEIGLAQAQVLATGAETLFLVLNIQNDLGSAIDVEPKHFYLLYRPSTETFQINFAEVIEEAPWSKTSMPAKSRMKCALYAPLPGKSLDVMYLVYNDGSYYRRTLVPQNFSRVPDKSFVRGPEWKATSPEAGGEPIVHDPGPQPANGVVTETPITPDSPTGTPEPPQASLAMAAGSALDLNGWHIEVGGNYGQGMIFNSLTAAPGKEFLIVEVKLCPQSDAAAQWPIGSNDFKAWHDSGRSHDSLGALRMNYSTPAGPKPLFAEWFQMKVGEPSAEVGRLLEFEFTWCTDRYVEALAKGREQVMVVVFEVPTPCFPHEYRLHAAFGKSPAEPPTAPAGSVIGPRWTNRSYGCKPDAVSLGDGQSFKTKFATEDWVVTLLEPVPLEGMYQERATLGDRGMVVRVSLSVSPWPFRGTSAAAPPLDTSGFGLRSPKGGEWKALGWLVQGPSGEIVVDRATIVGSDTVGEATVSADGSEATVRVGQGGAANLVLLLEGVKGEGSFAEYMLVHGLKTME